MNIYVGNLSYDVSETELRDLFGEFGEVTSVKIISDSYTGRSRGFAFVEMSTQEGGEKAIAELNGRDLKGRAITVNEARPREERSGGGGGGRGNFQPRGGRGDGGDRRREGGGGGGGHRRGGY